MMPPDLSDLWDLGEVLEIISSLQSRIRTTPREIPGKGGRDSVDYKGTGATSKILPHWLFQGLYYPSQEAAGRKLERPHSLMETAWFWGAPETQ